MEVSKAWFDVALFRCPHCGHYYVDASWYVAEIGSDIECGKCHMDFNTKKNMIDRVMLKFSMEEKGKLSKVEIAKHV